MIVKAASTLFGSRGWAATTLPMIAAEAGTAVDTIYSSFGSKSALLMAAFDEALAGDDDPRAMVDRPELADFAVGSPVERLQKGVHFSVAVYQRSLPVLKAVQEAAGSDPVARDRLAQYDQDRRDVMVVGLGFILDGPPSDTLVDAIWTLVSPEVYSKITEGRGWSVPKAEAWLVAMVQAVFDYSEAPLSR